MSILVNCQWAQWTLGPCSKSCNTGLRNKTREKTVQESNNGTCSGKAKVVEECNTFLCRSKNLIL